MALLKPMPRILAEFHDDAEDYRRRQQDRTESDPVLARLNDQIRTLGMEKLQRALDGQTSELIDERMRQLEAKHAVRLKAINVVPYRCARCKDTGIANGEYCTCLRNRIYQEHYGAYDPLAFPVNLDQYDMTVFDSETVVRKPRWTQRDMASFALKGANEVLSNLRESRPARSLLIHGEPGLGKSWLAGAIARQAAEDGIDVARIHAVSLFEAYHRVRLGHAVEMGYIETARLLVVDDLGAEPMTANVTIESLLHLLTYRIENQLPSVFVTNQPNIQSRYGERVSSRLYGETYQVLPMAGGDIRDATGSY